VAEDAAQNPFAEIDRITAGLSQGDLAKIGSQVTLVDTKHPATLDTQDLTGGERYKAVITRRGGGWSIILSQTCDLCSPCLEEPLVCLAPLVQLPSPSEEGIPDDEKKGRSSRIENAQRGMMVAYTPIPWMPDSNVWFADLRYMSLMEKGVLIGREIHRGLATDEQLRHLRDHLAQRFVRPALPDDFVKYILSPLRDEFQKRHNKQSPLGQALRSTTEMFFPRDLGDGRFVYIIDVEKMDDEGISRSELENQIKAMHQAVGSKMTVPAGYSMPIPSFATRTSLTYDDYLKLIPYEVGWLSQSAPTQ